MIIIRYKSKQDRLKILFIPKMEVWTAQWVLMELRQKWKEVADNLFK